MPRQQLSDILDQMRRYCVTQDRCHSEVRTKLLKKHVYGDDLEEILSQLVSEDFLNEERFARSYARGKFRMNKWGKFKIRMMLKQKQVSDYCIRKGLEDTEIAVVEVRQRRTDILELRGDVLQLRYLPRDFKI